jgi:molybdopterin molybdotransferase
MKKMKYLDYETAVQTSLDNAQAIKRFEKIPLESCIGRVLKSDVLCIKNIPSFNNSAMDGFAFKAQDEGKKLEVKGVIFAGDAATYNINNNEAYKIMTGAIIPNGADTIIPVEDTVKFDEKQVELPHDIKKGNHYRTKGEDYSIHDLICKKGTTLDAKMISLLAAQGLSMIEVYTKLNIAVLSTGSELKEPWQGSSEYEIYNSNSSGIIAILKENNFDAKYLGVVPDNLEDTTKFFNDLKSYDLIISTGGISMGDADFVAQAYENNNLDVLFHGVDVKPGRPTMMGNMGSTFVMAMPGNPLTALVNTYLFALPVIYKLSGSIEYYYDFVYAKSKSNFKVKSTRSNIVLGTTKAGEFEVFSNNKYGSGSFAPIVSSNSVILTLTGKKDVKEDELVKIILLNSKLNSSKTDIYNRV